MKYLVSFCVAVLPMTGMAYAGGCSGGDAPAGGYGTIVHEDGTMTAIYRSASVTHAYIVNFSKAGQATGGCSKESVAAWQARKAYMTAKSTWKAGYVPRKEACME